METLKTTIADWAGGNPKIRRVWVFGSPAGEAPRANGHIDIALELQPVIDSEETFVVWLANCEKWRRQLQATTGRTVHLDWFDPDAVMKSVQGGLAQQKSLVYERAS